MPPVREVSDVVHPTLPMLMDSVKSLYDQKSTDLVERAYAFADKSHGDERRLSGEPYISHPVATAFYLASMRLDAATVSAGLLHDVVEDTPATIDDVEGEFGTTIARLVDGVTKFAEIRRRAADPVSVELQEKRKPDYTREQAENLRKMFLAMAEDPRVVIVKLADRLHNMRTLEVLRPEKQRRIAADTQEIYAPLAGRLGIAQLKWPLEDLAFKYLEPERYWWLVQQLSEQLGSRRAFVEEMVTTLDGYLREHGIEASITGRPKHLYSIYRKLLKPDINMDVSRIFDLFALRVLVDDEAACYQALGLVHSIWPPMGSRIKDYIALPKPNGYRSLHTTVMPDHGRTIEVQIRSHEMHEIAEFGLAAHWYYKEQGQSVALPETLTGWVKSLTSWQQELGQDAADFVDTLKVDMFGGEVFVFSPKGDVIDLPVGSTPIDFAYRIHTDVGNRCIGSKVNGIMVPLSHELDTGDRVEILTTKTARGPSRDWLAFVKTASARQKIRQWFKRENRDENIQRGKELLDHELRRLDQRTLGEVKTDLLTEVAEAMHYRSLDDLYAAIGYGAQSPVGVVSRIGLRLQPDSLDIPIEAPRPTGPVGPGVQVMGTGNLLTRMASCCSPALGDPIVGYITRNRGVTVHREDCPRIRSEQERERLVPVEWGQQMTQDLYPVPVVIEAWDRDGLLRDIASTMSDERIGLTYANAITHNDGSATIHITVRIADIEHLSHAFSLLERLPGVTSVHRDGPQPSGGRTRAASA